jgi:hypothetical protein
MRQQHPIIFRLIALPPGIAPGVGVQRRRNQNRAVTRLTDGGEVVDNVLVLPIKGVQRDGAHGWGLLQWRALA